jgi:hypothetical protein
MHPVLVNTSCSMGTSPVWLSKPAVPQQRLRGPMKTHTHTHTHTPNPTPYLDKLTTDGALEVVRHDSSSRGWGQTLPCCTADHELPRWSQEVGLTCTRTKAKAQGVDVMPCLHNLMRLQSPTQVPSAYVTWRGLAALLAASTTQLDATAHRCWVHAPVRVFVCACAHVRKRASWPPTCTCTTFSPPAVLQGPVPGRCTAGGCGTHLVEKAPVGGQDGVLPPTFVQNQHATLLL